MCVFFFFVSYGQRDTFLTDSTVSTLSTVPARVYGSITIAGGERVDRKKIAEQRTTGKIMELHPETRPTPKTSKRRLNEKAVIDDKSQVDFWRKN